MQDPDVFEFDQFPDEVLMEIFENLDISSQLAVRLVSGRFDGIIREIFKTRFNIAKMQRQFVKKKIKLTLHAGYIEIVNARPVVDENLHNIISDINKTHNMYYLQPRLRKLFDELAERLTKTSQHIAELDKENNYGALRSDITALLLKLKPRAAAE